MTHELTIDTPDDEIKVQGTFENLSVLCGLIVDDNFMVDAVVSMHENREYDCPAGAKMTITEIGA